MVLMGTTGRGSAQQWPVVIAQQKGYFAEGGLTVDLIAAQSSSAIDILVKESGSERGDIGKSYDYDLKIKIFDRVGLIEGSQAKGLAEAMKSPGDLEGSTDVSRFVDPEIVELAKQVK